MHNSQTMFSWHLQSTLFFSFDFLASIHFTLKSTPPHTWTPNTVSLLLGSMSVEERKEQKREWDSRGRMWGGRGEPGRGHQRMSELYKEHLSFRKCILSPYSSLTVQALSVSHIKQQLDRTATASRWSQPQAKQVCLLLQLTSLDHWGCPSGFLLNWWSWQRTRALG